MTSATGQTPNDLFRFVNVRGPSRQKERPSRLAFVPLIFDELSADETAPSGSLYPALAATRDTAGALGTAVKLVRRYRGTDNFIVSAEAYRAAYPELAGFIGWLDVHAETASREALHKRFERGSERKPTAFTKTKDFREARCRIWDNLFANLFVTDDVRLVALACQYLGTLNLIDLMARGDLPDAAPGVAYRARPLVPGWLVALAAAVDAKPDEGVEDQSRPPAAGGMEDTKARYLSAIAAVEGLTRLAERQLRQVRDEQAVIDRQRRLDDAPASQSDTASREGRPGPKTVPSSQDPLRIKAADLKAIGKSTAQLAVDLLGEAPIYDLSQLSRLVGDEAVRLGSMIGERSRTRAIKVGRAVMEAGDFCAEFVDKDPCARSAREEFASRGSFTTSALIGDLLVTKQQLVKYDLGEVAHVETAMMGLDKTRTHRRLNRTEETDVYESLTSTEEERETQTTDRFDMEKESSKALEQNFQIDAGVNVTGSYGTVNFTSAVDTSYGSSSSQSQSEATSFSKNVTSRALSRVKESIRRSRSTTLLHETEETSVNKLANVGDDHINGVYRWLDKFYLNKIINYGKRLMFEFAVPEPAQFYLYRQMARPRPGATVIKPVDPRTASDPSGNALNTPGDLTDSNYAYWASLYGAGGVEPPPAAYLRVSEAWKNAYSTSQSGDIYDAFNASMKLPDNYLATYAEVQAAGYYWGSNDITGTLGTAYFGPGFTTISLPGISSAVSLALLTKGMNWKVSVVVTCQRSPELFGQWRAKTYGAIMDAYAARLREYQTWMQEQADLDQDTFSISGTNPNINRECEREELKKRCLEMFTGQRFEGFDAAVDGVFNVSSYPEILFAEAVREGNIVKFFEQAFDWPNMTYVFYPYFWGRKANWLSTTLLNDPADPLFTKFLQAGYARVVVPVRPEFENYLMLFHMLTNFVSSLGCRWNFNPSVFGAMGISNTFSPAIDDPTYLSIAEELQSAAGYGEEDGPIYGTPYIQKVPTNLVYIAQNAHVAGTPWPGLPDNSADPDIAPYL